MSNVYERLGVATIINAKGTATSSPRPCSLKGHSPPAGCAETIRRRIGETTCRFALLGFGFPSGGVAATSGVDFVLASRYRPCLLSFRSFGEAGQLVVLYGQCRDAFGFNEVDETPSERAAWRKVVEAIESG